MRNSPPAEPPTAQRIGAFGGRLSFYVYRPDRTSWHASLSAEAIPWIQFFGTTSGTGSVFIELLVIPNRDDARSAVLTVAFAPSAPPLNRRIEQDSAVPLATLNTAVLELPFPATPRVMELGILGKFAADQIQKVPAPFRPIALVIVEIAVVALGLIAILLRAAFAAKVPEPRTWLGAPPTFEELTAILPATAICITEETYLLALYILKSQS